MCMEQPTAVYIAAHFIPTYCVLSLHVYLKFQGLQRLVRYFVADVFSMISKKKLVYFDNSCKRILRELSQGAVLSPLLLTLTFVFRTGKYFEGTWKYREIFLNMRIVVLYSCSVPSSSTLLIIDYAVLYL